MGIVLSRCTSVCVPNNYWINFPVYLKLCMSIDTLLLDCFLLFLTSLLSALPMWGTIFIICCEYRPQKVTPNSRSMKSKKYNLLLTRTGLYIHRELICVYVLCVCVCMYVYMCVCVCMFVCVCVCMYVCMYFLINLFWMPHYKSVILHAMVFS